MIKLYYANCADRLSNAVFDGYLQQMPWHINERIIRFRRWQDAQASLFGKLLLKKGLGELGFNNSLDDMKYNNYGKPYIDNGLDFNISHSGNFVICAFSTLGKIGIDIEEMKPMDTTGFESQFTMAEWDAMQRATNNKDSFYYYWTAKEAVVKAVGKGLSIPLKEIVINETTAVVNRKVWHLRQVHLMADYIAQFASEVNVPDDIIPEGVFFN